MNYKAMALEEFFTILLICGGVFTIVMSIIIRKTVKEEIFRLNHYDYTSTYQIGKFSFKPLVILHYIGLVILHLLVMFCIGTVGGITDALWVSNLTPAIAWNEAGLGEKLGILVAFSILAFLPMVLTYMIGFLVMGLIRFTKKYSQLIFVITFALSVVFWSGYIKGYEKHIEIRTEVSETTTERELIFFYEIPIQQISGAIDESAPTFNGSISGEIFTVDTVPFVYLNDEGNGEWGAAPAKDSEIIFMTEYAAPKIVMVTTTEKTFKVDNNVGTSTVSNTNTWTKYYFYLPKTILQTFEG